MDKEPSHGHFLMLLRVTGVDAHEIDRAARQIDEEFMARFGDMAAFTAGLYELGRIVREGTNAEVPVPWNYALRYFGPATSVDWLQKRLEEVAKSSGGTVTTQTLTARDITGRY